MIERSVVKGAKSDNGIRGYKVIWREEEMERRGGSEKLFRASHVHGRHPPFRHALASSRSRSGHGPW